MNHTDNSTTAEEEGVCKSCGCKKTFKNNSGNKYLSTSCEACETSIECESVQNHFANCQNCSETLKATNVINHNFINSNLQFNQAQGN